MINHLVFDFDGTLADSEEICFQLFNEMAAKYGYTRLARHEVAEIKTLAYVERCRRLGIPMLRVPLLAIEARQRYERLMEALQPFEQIPSALRQLVAAGYHLHILSSNAVSNIRKFIERHDIDLFQTVSCERNFFGKHVGLQKFLRRHRLHCDEVVYMADEVRDVEACRKIGLPIFAVTWGFDAIEMLRAAKPDGMAASPSDLANLLESFAANRERHSAPALSMQASVNGY